MDVVWRAGRKTRNVRNVPAFSHIVNSSVNGLTAKKEGKTKLQRDNVCTKDQNGGVDI